jgi:hypothetical protein
MQVQYERLLTHCVRYMHLLYYFSNAGTNNVGPDDFMVQNATTSTNSNTTDGTATKQQQGMRGLDMWDKRGSFFGSLPRPHLPHVGSSSGGGLGSAFANLNLSVNSATATATATANTSTAATAGTVAASSGSGDSGATAGSSKKKKKRPNVWAERPARPPSGHSMFSPFSVNTNRFRPPSFRNVSIPR